MRFRVVKLRQGGRRLPRQQIIDSPATVGDVGILHAPDNQGIHQRIAVLRHPQSSQSHYLAVLYQPEVMSITSQALLLKGTERDQTGAESVQEWWCRFD